MLVNREREDALYRCALPSNCIDGPADVGDEDGVDDAFMIYHRKTESAAIEKERKKETMERSGRLKK